jgi:hypothetical protein
VDGTCPRCAFDLYKGKLLVDREVSDVTAGFLTTLVLMPILLGQFITYGA